MKVKFTKEAKQFVTVSELPTVKKIIADMKEDDGIKFYVESAVGLASGCGGGFEILKAEAEIAKNSRVYDAYGENTGNFDIWLEIYAFNAYDGFNHIGIYLTDIWALADDNREEIKDHMYIANYSRKK